MLTMNGQEYIKTFANEKAFSVTDKNVPAVAGLIEGDATSQQILESVTIEKLALTNLQRVEAMEQTLRENPNSSGNADALIMKAKEYPELPSPNILLTKPDFLSTAVLIAGVKPELLGELSTSNMFETTALGGKGMELLEMGRVTNMVETAKSQGSDVSNSDKLGQKIVVATANLLG